MALHALVEEYDYDHAHMTRKESIVQMINKMQKFVSDSHRTEFSDLFEEATNLLELEDAELARMLKVSQPTIGRWKRGDSAPHHLGREPVFRILMRNAQSKLRFL